MSPCLKCRPLWMTSPSSAAVYNGRHGRRRQETAICDARLPFVLPIRSFSRMHEACDGGTLFTALPASSPGRSETGCESYFSVLFFDEYRRRLWQTMFASSDGSPRRNMTSDRWRRSQTEKLRTGCADGSSHNSAAPLGGNGAEIRQVTDSCNFNRSYGDRAVRHLPDTCRWGAAT